VLIRVVVVLAAVGLVAGGGAVRVTGAGGSQIGGASAHTASTDSGAPGIGDPYFPDDGNGGIDVRSYAVHDTYLFTGRLSGQTLITLRTTQRLSSFDLDFLLPVSSVRLSSGPSTYSRPDGHELRIQPDRPIEAGTTVRVTVTYAGRPSRFGYAGERNWVATAHEVEALNEPHSAPWWFPSNDHPLDKARMDLRVTVPRGRQVISNGRLLGVRRAGDRTTYHWGDGGPMATYLAFFVAGRFEVRTGVSHHLPYEVAVSRGLGDAARRSAMHGLLTTPAIVAWLQRELGSYPFARTGGVVTALDPGFSLEDQTRPVYPKAVFRLLMVHELAHQWFGDSVSVHHWTDVWLNEGFATYMEHRWTESHGGVSTGRWLHDAYAATPATSSFWDLVVADPGADHLFDWPVYQRGAMTLAALRQRIGASTFAHVLRRWAAEHRHGHGTTAAFEALGGQLSGVDLSVFFQTWLHSPGRPPATAANGL
jgi:aminopeptidase N